MKVNIIKYIYFIIGVFFVALIYNLIFVPNNIITGGVSGIAIVLKELFGISTTTFINISNVLLIIICFIFLGKERTYHQLAGCIVYPLMISLTEPLAKIIPMPLDFNLAFLLIISVIHGISIGIIYRAGFSTGGFDILLEILSVKFKKSITWVGMIINISILLISALVFKPLTLLYSIAIVYLSNKVCSVILYGISSKKMVYIVSKKSKEIENYVLKEIHTGATEMSIRSGIFDKHKQMLMCVVHNSQYEKFKKKVLTLDPTSFIASNNCYEVDGGVMKHFLPF